MGHIGHLVKLLKVEMREECGCGGSWPQIAVLCDKATGMAVRAMSPTLRLALSVSVLPNAA